MNGKRYILTSPTIKANCLQYINEDIPLPEKGKRPYEVIVRKHVESITEQQRAGFHWLCKCLGDELGYTLQEIKEMAKKECMGCVGIKIGERVIEVTDSSEKLNKIEYSDLIECVYRLGAEAGVVLPTLDRWRAV